MIKREELLRSKEYWTTKIQTDIYDSLVQYMESEGINQTQLAKRLEVSKGYISQILNGNFNFSLKKLVELLLVINKVPLIEFCDLESYLRKDELKRKYKNINKTKVKESSVKSVRRKRQTVF